MMIIFVFLLFARCLFDEPLSRINRRTTVDLAGHPDLSGLPGAPNGKSRSEREVRVVLVGQADVTEMIERLGKQRVQRFEPLDIFDDAHHLKV
jgi:hypothetical protein